MQHSRVDYLLGVELMGGNNADPGSVRVGIGRVANDQQD